MATIHGTVVFAVTLVLLLHSVDAIHIFGNALSQKTTQTSTVSPNAVEENQFVNYMLKKHRTHVNVKSHQYSRARRIARHSEGYIERIQNPGVWRYGNSKRNTRQESKAAPYINKDAYLSLCHFKICNMGRKRSSRSIQTNPHQNNAALQQ